ncbi:MAG TPA: 1-deoxy-D-xylulose-5-phosphate reductoisomerase [Pseudomonadales bacterium]|nr:1-deoxy-D-xylulose-5-phosphate reductoisomerase [Pseudomonadales bacterium]
MQKRKGVTVLGSTGSIGQSTLDVIGRHPDQFELIAITANGSVDQLFQQCVQHMPRFAVLRDHTAADRLEGQLRAAGLETEVLAGEPGLEHVAAHPDADYVMAAIVGAAGLLPTLAAVKAGKRILLANKEAIVMGGALFMTAVREHGAELLPIDSEHNAIFQCLPSGFQRGLNQVGVRRILLTGSGGPFRQTPLETLSLVTPDQACNHPNWSMGRKISVDSATMMNKGLEFIEACWLFNAQPNQIEILIHPESVIHSMVEYVDGSVIAQLGNPDMRTPIAYGLAWPSRCESGVGALDLVKQGQLTFQSPDEIRFPALRLAREAFLSGGTASAILNAANEEAVAAFLAGNIAFTEIASLVEKTLESVTSHAADSLDTILSDDRSARHRVQELMAQR